MAYRAVGAAVVRLAAFDELSPDAMQRIAAELNASATAFIAPAEAVSCVRQSLCLPPVNSSYYAE